MSNTQVIMPLAKVMIAAAWADGSISNDEINCLKDLLFQMPEMTASDWSELEIYIDSPVEEAERERLVAELQAALSNRGEKELAMNMIDELAQADGELPEYEQAVVDQIKEEIQAAQTSLVGGIGKMLGGSIQRRSKALNEAPNRELYLEDYQKNRIFYSLSRRLELDQTDIHVSEDELRKLSLAGGLMARVAYADNEVQQSEFKSISKAIQDHWELPAGHANLVAEIAVSEISKGMDVVDRISAVETAKVDRRGNVPVEDVKLISAKSVVGKTVAKRDRKKTKSEPVSFVEGEHYVVLDRPVPTRDSSKVEVVEMFSYGCPHCYEFEPSIKAWSKQQSSDVDFWYFPAVWNKPMALYARAFYTARELKVEEKIHQPLFTAIVMEQKSIRNESDLADYFSKQGVDNKGFTEVFNSPAITTEVKYAEERVRLYKPVGVPEIIVNGKYRIDRMRAGGLEEMLAVADYLVEKERATLKE